MKSTFTVLSFGDDVEEKCFYKRALQHAVGGGVLLPLRVDILAVKSTYEVGFEKKRFDELA